MGADQRDVDAAGDQRFERRIGRWLGKAVEPAALQVRDSRRELKAKQGEGGLPLRSLGLSTAPGPAPDQQRNSAFAPIYTISKIYSGGALLNRFVTLRQGR